MSDCKADVPPGLVTPIMPFFDTQGYLVKMKSGLAPLKIKTPEGMMSVSAWIDSVANQFNIPQQYMLMVLEAEQNLVRDRTTYLGEVRIQSLPNKPPAGEPVGLDSPSNWKPPLPPGFNPADSRVVRNGGPKYVADGNWYVAVSGPWKYLAALGSGIPDPKKFPAWDVRKYLGLANQIYHCGRLTRKFLTDFAAAKASGNVAAISVPTYEGQTVVAADAVTFAMLQWNPSLKGIAERPKIAKSLGLVA